MKYFPIPREELKRKIAVDTGCFREARITELMRANERYRRLPKMTAGFIDGRFPSETLDAIAKLIRGLPDIIENCDVSEQLMRALDFIDAARALIEQELEG
jgi:hypothetical protein